MKKYLFVFLLLPSIMANCQVRGFLDRLNEFIENTSVFELNQEEGRAYFIPQKSMSLNGSWKFHYSDTPGGIPSDFFSTGFNDSKWGTIPVPGNWEMNGYGDRKFRNVSLSFTPNPPFVPDEYNPSGAYRTTFLVPSPWKGDQIFLRFEKAASASFVWINGREVGYNEGGQEPSEYNITKYIRPGKNTLAVAVLKFSDGYYIEDQDYWRFAGIFDDVWLYAAPVIRLSDWQVITDLDSQYRDADLKIGIEVKNYSSTGSGIIKAWALLTDDSGHKVAEFTSGSFSVNPSEKKRIDLSGKVIDPAKWTAETPVLYTLNLQLSDVSGKRIDQAIQRFGFKETEIRGETFFLNGVPIKVNAQNSHMQHPENGHVMDEKTIRRDFEIMKQFNFNAVRTSHYPPVNKYLELADEYGLYIIDEAGTEAHSAEKVSNMAEFTEMYKERARKMVLRDRNHPCVLFWSAGNESGQGFNIAEVITEGKRLDSTRFWMYGGNRGEHPSEDIIGPRYPTPIELDMHIGIIPKPNDRRPSFMDEYLSVAGNGGGALDDYWRVVYTHPRIIGGAIWDFVSPGITERIRRIPDCSPYNTHAHVMGNAKLVTDNGRSAIDLNGHDQWVEVYRQQNLERFSDKLTITCEVYPRKLNYSSGTFVTKGSHQFGLKQSGKDSLEFYIYTDGIHSLKTALPDNWEYNWHKISAVYDGQEMSIFLNNRKVAGRKAKGIIQNFPFPVNIGRNAEEQGQNTREYLCDAIITNVGIFDSVVNPLSLSPAEALLWLDFEQELDEGTFYSYGIGARTYGCIWPDRVPQPEMWQMKKTCQPIKVDWIDAEQGWAEVWNRNAFLPASFYKTSWELYADEKVIEKGELHLETAPLTKEIIKIPFTRPHVEAGKEYRISVSSILRKDNLWAKSGYEVAWDQLELPWFKPEDSKTPSIFSARIEKKTNQEILVTGNDFTYRFDMESGSLVSMQIKGREMLKEGISLNVWRAPLANEQDQWNAGRIKNARWKTGFGNYVVTEMYSAGLHQLSHTLLSSDVKELEGKVYVTFREIALMNENAIIQRDAYIRGVACNGFESIYRYEINGDGEILLEHTIVPQGNMPLWLPRIGITLTLADDLSHVEWYGRGPQENYPDRKTGYKIGRYSSTVEQMFEPYLMPQDYGLRSDVRWVAIKDKDGNGLHFSVNNFFNFNAYPYSTDNLTKAMYQYQLKEQDGITFNLDYVTSGVGCTARSIFPAYRSYPQKYQRKITIVPIGINN
jgi:beta-galactosidase